MANREIKSCLVPIDGDKLRARIARTGKPLSTLSVELGHGRSYLNDNIRYGRMNKYALDLLAEKCGFSAEAVILPEPEPETEPEPEPEQEPATEPECQPVTDGIERQLARIADALEKLAEMPALSGIERCVLLLNQMVCYGGCKRMDFVRKAKECGFGADTQEIAMRIADVKCEMRNGVEWLSKS